jgi:hypothetical protein
MAFFFMHLCDEETGIKETAADFSVALMDSLFASACLPTPCSPPELVSVSSR